MVTFKSYDNIEDAFEDMRKNEQVANSRVKPSQRSISWGDYWMAIYPDLDLVVFGYIYTMDENEKSEKAAGSTTEEWAYTKSDLLDSYERGYRFGMAYSTVVPDGELGSTHIVNMVPISAENFEEAKALRWNIDEIRMLPWVRDAVVKTAMETVE